MEKKETKTLGTREKNLIRIISDLRGGLLHVLKNEEEEYMIMMTYDDYLYPESLYLVGPYEFYNFNPARLDSYTWNENWRDDEDI